MENKKFWAEMARPLHGDQSGFDPVGYVAHKSETSWCNYCRSPFLEGSSQKNISFLLCFVLFQFLSLPPLFDFQHRENEELGDTFKDAFHFLFLFFCTTHFWLWRRLVSQSREGDGDLLSAQPHNNKITSLPTCSGHAVLYISNLVCSHLLFKVQSQQCHLP